MYHMPYPSGHHFNDSQAALTELTANVRATTFFHWWFVMALLPARFSGMSTLPVHVHTPYFSYLVGRNLTYIVKGTVQEKR